jgi:hypothetical protein
MNLESVAGWTGLEPAASGVTGRRSNQLNYHPSGELQVRPPSRCALRWTTFAWLANRSSLVARVSEGWWAVQGSNLRQPACKAGALPLS